MAKANRYNEGKARWDLIPMYALDEIAKVYEYGTKKYDDHNWRKGLEWNKGCAASLLRHLSAWQDGEDYDPESGLPHDVHIAWNAITLVAIRLKNEGTDDRYRADEQDTDAPTSGTDLLARERTKIRSQEESAQGDFKEIIEGFGYR